MSSIVTKDFVAGALTNFRAAFDDYYAKSMLTFPIAGIATEVPSTADTEDYSWLGDYPAVREFVGERVYKSMRAMNYSLRNKTWEDTIAIKRDTFEDDGKKLGILKPRVTGLADAFIRFKHRLLMETLLANGLGYDNIALFSASHTIGESGTQSNLLTGTGVTLAQVTADYVAARAALMAYKTDTGEHFNANLDLTVLCPPALFGVFEQLQKATTISQTTNVLFGGFKLIVSPYLASLTGGDANDWYLLNKVGFLGPLIWQDREMPVLDGITDPESDHVFKYNEYLWGARARSNAGVGLWQLAVKTTNT